jgi:hypothetical protein
LYVAYNAVHSPLQAADKYMNKFKHIEGRTETHLRGHVGKPRRQRGGDHEKASG